jgi:hypothetical protein
MKIHVMPGMKVVKEPSLRCVVLADRISASFDVVHQFARTQIETIGTRSLSSGIVERGSGMRQFVPALL